MYSFDPSEEQQMFIDVARRYAENELRPASRMAEETSHLAASVVAGGWQLGILQAALPEDMGGLGERSVVTAVLAMEELAWGDMAGALAVMTPSLFALPILLCGSAEQQAQYLPRFSEDEWRPYSGALIEPRFDFDALALTTKAERSAGDFVLTGRKCMVPFASEAEGFIVYGELEGQSQGFIVPRSCDGLTIGERERLMGINALPCYGLELNGVRVPAGARLGGAAGHDMERIVCSARIALSAVAVGLARASFEYSRDYAKDREVLGSKIAQKQSIAFMIAEMATEIEVARLLTWEAAWLFDQGATEAARSAYLALTAAMDMAMMVTDRGVQILGGHGYVRDHPVELWLRNGRGIASLTGLVLV